MTIVYVRFPLRSAAPRERAPLLERLLARATRLPRGISGAGHWREDALQLLGVPRTPAPNLAPLALLADVGPVPGAWALLATPVHCAATMTSVRLSPAGILPLDAAAASALAGDFQRVFPHSPQRLIAGRSGALFTVFAAPLTVHTRDPSDALDQDVWDFLPSGADAAALRRLMSEIELWLFDHEINRARQARTLAPITGLWLWGGGAPLRALPALVGWTAGTDAFFGALPLHGAANRGTGSGVVVVADAPGTTGWREAEARWLRPALRDLAGRRIDAIELSAGERCFRVDPGWRWHVWRRTRPWWEWFES